MSWHNSSGGYPHSPCGGLLWGGLRLRAASALTLARESNVLGLLTERAHLLRCEVDVPSHGGSKLPSLHSSQFEPGMNGALVHANGLHDTCNRIGAVVPPQTVGSQATLDRKSTRSELQSPCNLVCRLLLEKKNRAHIYSSMS